MDLPIGAAPDNYTRTTSPPSYLWYTIGRSEHYAAVARHLGTMNVLFCDGHVKTVRFENIFATITMANGDKIMTNYTNEDD